MLLLCPVVELCCCCVQWLSYVVVVSNGWAMLLLCPMVELCCCCVQWLSYVVVVSSGWAMLLLCPMVELCCCCVQWLSYVVVVSSGWAMLLLCPMVELCCCCVQWLSYVVVVSNGWAMLLCVFFLVFVFFVFSVPVHPKAGKWLSSPTHSSCFSPFSCCLNVFLWLDKGDYPENSHVAFCPNKWRSFGPFMCLDLLLAINRYFLLAINRYFLLAINRYLFARTCHTYQKCVCACMCASVCVWGGGGGKSCMRAICVVCVCARWRETEYCGWAERGEREFSLMCLFVTEFTNV